MAHSDEVVSSTRSAPARLFGSDTADLAVDQIEDVFRLPLDPVQHFGVVGGAVFPRRQRTEKG